MGLEVRVRGRVGVRVRVRVRVRLWVRVSWGGASSGAAAKILRSAARGSVLPG